MNLAIQIGSRVAAGLVALGTMGWRKLRSLPLIVACVAFVTVLGACAQTFTVVHSFGGLSDGAVPYAGVAFDQGGSLYGTTYGSTTGTFFGAVYKIDSSGRETVLRFLRARDGNRPFSVPLVDPSGNIYETNGEGSFSREGSVLELNKLGQPRLLFSWGMQHRGSFDGTFPRAGLIRDQAGNLYGTTSLGGTQGGAGTVYKVDHLTGAFTLIYSFGVPPDGCSPTGELVLGLDGELYGTTDIGGQFGWGTIFKVDPITGIETVLYSFTDGADGGNPLSELIEDSAGSFYSTTAVGGEYGFGTVFEFTPDGAKLTTLHNFGSGGSDGATPFAGVTRDQAGNLYGTTTAGGTIGYGVVYKLEPDGSFTNLHNFSRGTDGGVPYARVTLHGNSLYGTTALGGDPSCDCGVVFKVTP